MSFRLGSVSCRVVRTVRQLLLLFSAWTLVLGESSGEEATYVGPVDVVAGPARKTLYVVARDAKRIDVVDVEAGMIEKHLAGQGIAVGVQAARRKADQHIAAADGSAGDDATARDGSYDRSDQVVLAVRVESRHLGGLPAEQGAAVPAARLAQAGHDIAEHRAVQARGAEVVHEEQRPGEANSPPNAPMSFKTPAVRVRRTMRRAACSPSIISSISTPAAA